MTRRVGLAIPLALLAAALSAQDNLDWATLGRIRDEGFRRSQVMETAAQLTDVHGPRLTGSPQYKKAADWARQQLEAWGLANARLESWPFGRGWSFDRCSAHVVAPVAFDNGTGRIRGIYLQENAAAKPVFEGWLDAVKDLGATRLTMRNTSGTDHVPFDGVGVPAFQFIQDPIEYLDGEFFGTHHTDMDVFDRLQRDDLVQAAVVIATFAYNAASRVERMPRKPLPKAAPLPLPDAAREGEPTGATPAPRPAEAAPGGRPLSRVRAGEGS